jgi:hypothetical protein
MVRNEKLELAGPFSVIGGIACAELGAYALAIWPTSTFLWYLNLEIFRAFRHSFDGLNIVEWVGMDGLTQSIWVAIPLLGLVSVGLIVKLRLPLAIASNLSLIYSAFLLFGTCTGNQPATEFGIDLSRLVSPSGFFAATILLASILSSTISHWGYWREIFS